jgi:hypothetical protein
MLPDNVPTDTELCDYMDKIERNKQLKEAIEVIFRNLNCMGREKEVGEAIVDVIDSQHRTLQQAFMRNVMVPIIQSFAKRYGNGFYDLRNEATVKACIELNEVLGKHGFPFI